MSKLGMRAVAQQIVLRDGLKGFSSWVQVWRKIDEVEAALRSQSNKVSKPL